MSATPPQNYIVKPASKMPFLAVGGIIAVSIYVGSYFAQRQASYELSQSVEQSGLTEVKRLADVDITKVKFGSPRFYLAGLNVDTKYLNPFTFLLDQIRYKNHLAAECKKEKE